MISIRENKWALPVVGSALIVLVGSVLYLNCDATIVPADSMSKASGSLSSFESNQGSDEYLPIVLGQKYSFYCKMIGGYESSPTCLIYLKKDGEFSDTGLYAWNPETTLLLSPDKAHILIINGAVRDGSPTGEGNDNAVLLNIANAEHRVIYEAPKETYLGVFTPNIDFKGRARWIDNSHIELKIYAANNANDELRNPNGIESQPLLVKQIQI